MNCERLKMAYFSNGSEGILLDLECDECPLGPESPCPIYHVQASYNYESCNNKTAREILNCLVHQTPKYEYKGCQMKPLLEELFKNQCPHGQ